MATINKQISLGTDDCHQVNGTVQLSGTKVFCGLASGSTYNGGLRWQSINMERSSSITSAKLSMYIHNDVGLSANIRGIDEDNTATWATGDGPNDRTKTTATITANKANWSNYSVGAWAYIYITSVIQEIIDRAGWSANNALAIVLENTSVSDPTYMEARSYDYAGNTFGAKLDIVYEPPVGRTTKNTRSTSNTHTGVMFQTLTGGHGY